MKKRQKPTVKNSRKTGKERSSDVSADYEFRTQRLALPFLSPGNFELLISCMKDSGFIWSSLVEHHRIIRQERRKWPTAYDLNTEIKGIGQEMGLVLPMLSVQLVIKQFLGNVETTRQNRATQKEAGPDHSAFYPYRSKHLHQVSWGSQSFKITARGIALYLGKVKEAHARTGKIKSVSRGNLLIPIKNVPANTVEVSVVNIRGEGFVLLLKRRFLKKSSSNQQAQGEGTKKEKYASLDQGIIHSGAAMTEDAKSLIVSGRGLRALKQNRNRVIASFDARISRTQKGSARRRRLITDKRSALRTNSNQISNSEHSITCILTDFYVSQGITKVFVGDPSGVRNKDIGKRANQENSQWTMGRIYSLLAYKLAEHGIDIEKVNESYTTKTCPKCSHQHKPSGRVYKCTNSECDFVGHRDSVGAWNILCKSLKERDLQVPKLEDGSLAVDRQKYRRPFFARGNANRHWMKLRSRPGPGLMEGIKAA